LDPITFSVNDSDDATVITSNTSRDRNVASARNIASALQQGVPKTLAFADTHAIADTGATSIFVMAGTPMKNIHPATDPLTINLPNGEIVHSTHICDISIPGLPSPDDPDRAYCPGVVYGLTHGNPSSMQGRMQSDFY
jgi:hypothetical protein